MTTRELERTLRHFANYLATIPEFDVEGCVSIMEGSITTSPYVHVPIWDRYKFIAAVKAIGSSKKVYTEGDYAELQVTADAFPIKLSIARDKVCKKSVVYDCEPLFSEAEVAKRRNQWSTDVRRVNRT
jgi:hypothetical protein